MSKMVRHGIMTSVYLQRELEPKIAKILEENQDIYKSRNQLINAAIVREIRRVESNGKP